MKKAVSVILVVIIIFSFASFSVYAGSIEQNNFVTSLQTVWNTFSMKYSGNEISESMDFIMVELEECKRRYDELDETDIKELNLKSQKQVGSAFGFPDNDSHFYLIYHMINFFNDYYSAPENQNAENENQLTKMFFMTFTSLKLAGTVDKSTGSSLGFDAGRISRLFDNYAEITDERYLEFLDNYASEIFQDEDKTFKDLLNKAFRETKKTDAVTTSATAAPKTSAAAADTSLPSIDIGKEVKTESKTYVIIVGSVIAAVLFIGVLSAVLFRKNKTNRF